MTDEPIGFDAPEVTDEPLKDPDGTPVCPVHVCRMEYSSGGQAGSRKSYWKCNVPGCKQSAAKVKRKIGEYYPKQAQTCPRCSKKKKQVYCVKDEQRSTPREVVLICERCDFSVAIPDPRLAAMHLGSRNQPQAEGEDIGAR